ncbi:hypothetical protein OAG24_00410 [bacterium]|nr:hypothetical protein [bacterium]
MKVLIAFKNDPSKFLTFENSNVFMRHRMTENPAQIWNIEKGPNSLALMGENGVSFGYEKGVNNVSLSNKAKNAWHIDEHGQLKTNDDRYLWSIGDRVYLTQDEYLAEPMIIFEVKTLAVAPRNKITESFIIVFVIAIMVIVAILFFIFVVK